MNKLKSTIRIRENTRRRNFAIKLVLLIIFEILYESDRPLGPVFEQFVILGYVFRAVIFGLSSNLIISLGRFITLSLYLRHREEAKVQPNFVVGIDRIATLLNVLSLLISMMLAFGIRPLEFLTSITIVAAAIALLTKDYITNIVNGLIMMFSDQLEIGDKVQIGKHTGFIRDITLINLVLKNDSGEIVLIPNNMALSSDVINYSKNNTHQVIFDFELSNQPQLDLNSLENELSQPLKSHPELVILEGANLHILERKSETLLLRFQFPLKSSEISAEPQLIKKIDLTLLHWNHERRQNQLL